MLYAAVFHFLAGILTGSVFRVRTLLAILFFIFSEFVVLLAMTAQLAAVWAIINLLAIQMGYCAGVLMRRLAERTGYLVPQVRSPE